MDLANPPLAVLASRETALYRLLLPHPFGPVSTLRAFKGMLRSLTDRYPAMLKSVIGIVVSIQTDAGEPTSSDRPQSGFQMVYGWPF
jgi:hypothetical protein